MQLFIKKRIKIIVSLLCIIISLFLIIVNYIKNNNIIKKEKELVINYQKNISNINYISNDYDMFIEIEKINLYKGIYNINSDKNNVKYNIEILKDSSMPNVINGNLILAGHSGNGKSAYFNNLKDLTINDEINIYFNKNKYVYKIVNIYEIDKNGIATIKRDSNKSCLTLITCSTKDKTKQIIIISELLEKKQLSD